MDEELLPTASTMPVIASTNFPTPTTPTTPSIYPNLQQEIVQDLSEEVNTGSQQLGRSPSINPVVTASSSTTTTTGNNNSYLSTSVNYSSGGNVTFHSSPAHRSKTNRKKSRKLTLTQVCSDGSPSKTAEQQQQKSNTMDADRMSNNSSLIGFESDNNSTTTASTSSSLKSGPERKINRIFSMLQTMQQTFLQNNPPQQPPPQPPQQQPPPPTSSHHHHQGKLPKEPIYEQPHHNSNNRSSDSLESGTDTIHSGDRRGQQMRMELPTSSSAPSRQLLYGLGRSQDSLMSTRISTGNKTNFMAVNNSNSNVNNKGPIYASWNGSQYSTNTYTTMTSDGAASPPPMTHAMPYHKDGWTSLFIVASSTYAQLLIVMCMVAALAEVVTHNVSFVYFEIFFAFLYTVSIIFFLYVFGYLLRSKRRREERKRLRKLSRWKESNMSNPSNNGTTTEDETSDYDSVQVDRNVSSAMSVENEISTIPSPMRRFFNNFSGERRRFSRSDPSEMMESVSSNPHPASRKSSANKQWTMPQNFNLGGGGGTPAGEMVSYCTMTSNNSDIVTTHSAAVNGRKAKKTKVSDNEHSHGSLFLRAGAVAFGLGTMIYDGLEFGAFLEVPPDSPCFALLRGLNPLLHAVFVFLQMYFIFVSARLNIHKFKVIARFGLMHCVATNVCVWIRTLVRESLKEINGHYHHYVEKSVKTTSHQPVVSAGGYDSASNALLHHLVEAVAAVAGSEESSFEGGASAFFDIVNETFADALTTAAPMAAGVKSKKEISLWELTGNVSCGRRIYLGNIIMDAAPFLYPFLIEYSLIGAAVLYVIWEHIGLNPKYKTEEENNRGIKDESIWNSRTRQLRVDCVGASKGLFMGLFFLTASLLCLVLFFIFVPMPQFKRLGLILGDSAHCTLLLVSLIAMAIGAYRARHLHFHSEHMEELGSILLRISALGIFMYSAFSMIAGALGTSKEEPPTLVFINGLLSVIEVTVQTIFISDMSRRSVNTIEQDREKPGRQSVTFLLITNLTLWLVYTFEMQKVEANPVQLNFYGFMPWSIVQRISLPLCIFYRFHSAMVYAEIWKNSFRYHGPTMEELTTTANISGSAIHLN